MAFVIVFMSSRFSVMFRRVFWVVLGFLAGYFVFGGGSCGRRGSGGSSGGFRHVLVDCRPVLSEVRIPRFSVDGIFTYRDTVLVRDSVLCRDTVYVVGEVDTAGVVRDYFERREYRYEFGSDSVGVCDFRGVVWMNRLQEVVCDFRGVSGGSAVPRGPLLSPWVFGGFGDGLGYGLLGVEFRGGLMLGGGGYGSSFGGGYLLGVGWRF